MAYNMTFWGFLDKHIPLVQIPLVIFVIVTVFIFLWVFVFRSAYDTYVSSKAQQSTDRNKMYWDYQKAANEKLLEIETIKIQRVLPQFEIISRNISEHAMMYATYLQHIYCKSDFGAVIYKSNSSKTMEEIRVEIDINLIKSISMVNIYIPYELRCVLNQIRLIVSCSWISGRDFKQNIINDGINYMEFAHRSTEILKEYRECFFDMVSQYCNLSNHELSYSEIAKKHFLDEQGKYIGRNDLDTYVLNNILLYEYSNQNKADEL